MEACDFAFGPIKEPELDGLRKLTLTGKIFHVFSPQDWKSQLRLIDDCYKRHQNMVSELLKVGAPDKISPLFTEQWALLTMRGWRHGLCVLCWRLVFFPDWLRASRRNVFCSVRDCSDSGNTTSCGRYITPLICFVLCKRNSCNASFVKNSECGSACRYAARDGSGGVERWPIWVRLYVFGRKKSCCSVLIRRSPAPTHTHSDTHIQSHTYTHPQTHIHKLSVAKNHMRNVHAIHAIICIYIHTRCS